jgi:hypothetical protein
MDPDLGAYSTHQDLVVAVYRQSVEASPMATLLNWKASDLNAVLPPTLSFALLSRVTIEQLRMLKSFRSYCTIPLPGATNQDRRTTNTVMSTSNLERLNKAVRAVAVPPKPWHSLELVSIGVLTRSNDKDPADLFAPNNRPLWKWAKPTSVYPRKTGSWDLSLAESLRDGEWSAGRDLSLLVRMVPLADE